MKRLGFLIFLIFPLSLFSAPKYPFPQNTDYPFGIKPQTVNNNDIQDAFDDFMTRFYEESGDKARIKWDTPSQTVSEGIGYGMLIMVYMDNNTNNTQDKFDKLWKYYNSYLDSCGLMNWKINGFSGIAEKNAATDAELDVAVALMQAYKQWGDEKYFEDAKILIDKIWKYEINANGYIKPGDAWDLSKNPSYFSTAALELFKKAGTQDWQKVITNCYSLLKKVRNSTTGLVPDWCTEAGNPSGDYKYDAARTPWRIAWGYLWYGHSDAKEFCSKVSTWIAGKTGGDPTTVVDGYKLDGSDLSQYYNSTFLGAFACAGMVDQTHQNWLNSAYNAQVSLLEQPESYYNTSLRVIYLLLLSGNMPDFWNTSSFTITVSCLPANSGTVSFSSPGTQFPEGTSLTLTATPSTNFVFKSWGGDLNGTEISKSFTVTKDMNVTAIFDPAIPVNLHLASSNSKFSISTRLANICDMISFDIPIAGDVNIDIYSSTGKKVGTLANGYFKAGQSNIKLTKPLSNGIYWVRLECNSGKLVRQLAINK